MTTKSTGMRKMAIPVENSMPVIVTVPISRRAWPPAPSAFHSGNSPKMNANDVMRIGRSRRRAPFSAASTSDSPFSSSALANSTMRIAFFAERPISMRRPIWAYTSLSRRRIQRPTNAPATAIGVLSSTLHGSDQLW